MFCHTLLNSHNLAGQLLTYQIQNPQNNSWYNYVNQLLLLYKLPSSPDTIKVISQKSWKRQVETRIQANFQNWYTKEGLTKTKLNCLIRHKPHPSLAPYIQHLTRNNAAIIFRLRTGMTRAENNYSSQPVVCNKCNRGHASKTHYFQSCPALSELRRKYQIEDLLEVFVNSNNTEIMIRYAQFALEAKLLPDFF